MSDAHIRPVIGVKIKHKGLKAKKEESSDGEYGLKATAVFL